MQDQVKARQESKIQDFPSALCRLQAFVAHRQTVQAFVYDGSKYAEIRGSIYKIERTYVNGQFIELYLTLTDLKSEDFK